MRRSRMSFSNLPHAIGALLQAAGKRDAVAFLAAFAADAALVDGDVEHRGDAIRTWIGRFLEDGSPTVHPINVARREGRTVLTVVIKRAGGAIDGRAALQCDW